MKKLYRFNLALLLCLMAGASAKAQLTVNVDRVTGYFQGSGGELHVTPAVAGDPAFAPYLALYAPTNLVAGGFETWCMEVDEHLFGGPYLGTISDEALLGGPNYSSPPGALGGDPISKGTAYLYTLFAAGTLPGYNYTPGPGRESCSAPLQNVFWLLEDEFQLNPMDATQTAMYNNWIALLVSQFGSLDSAKQDNAGLYPVGVLNLVRQVDGSNAQDVLILRSSCNGQIGNFVWKDLNGNGCQDAGEPGIGGMPVVLYSGCGLSGTPIATNLTDSAGHYLFTNLCSDTYTVGFTTPAGYKRTLAKVGCVDASNPDNNSNQTDSKCDCASDVQCGICVQLTDANPINLNVDCGYVLLPDVICAASTGAVGTPYSSQVVANGGCLPYQSYAIISGSLPPGLNINPTTGLISGTPTTAGTFPYVVQVTDNCGNTASTLGENCNITITGCPPCAAHDIQYNFNGTQIIFQSTPGGSYVWFIADGVVKNLPKTGKAVLHISGQTITIPAVGASPQYVIPVPDAIITFDASATQATTTFDTFNNVWLMTYPSSGMSGNIFYGAAAFKVPAVGLPGGIKNVDWKGSFTTDTAGLNVSWQWSAANYKNFTGNYNSIAPKPTDDTSKSIYKNSDHAGTPEGTDPSTSQPWKNNVVGGGSGGGGGNYTGSGSSTLSFPPCICPTP